MKISDKEVNAALSKYYSFKGSTAHDNMRAALESAYTVRKARKAAKRAKSKPNQPEPDHPEHRFKVGDRVVHPGSGGGVVANIAGVNLPYFVRFDMGHSYWCDSTEIEPEPAKPAWNGKFEVGKAYRTRDGRKAEINLRGIGKYPLIGRIGCDTYAWADNGVWSHGGENNYPNLIGPWED